MIRHSCPVASAAVLLLFLTIFYARLTVATGMASLCVVGVSLHQELSILRFIGVMYLFSPQFMELAPPSSLMVLEMSDNTT